MRFVVRVAHPSESDTNWDLHSNASFWSISESLDCRLHAAPEKISKRRHIIKHHTLSSQQRTSWSATAGPFWGWHIPHWLCEHQCCRSSPSLKPQFQQPPHLWGRRSPQTKFNSWYSCQTHDVHSSAKFQVDTLSLLYNRFLIWHLVLLQTLVD